MCVRVYVSVSMRIIWIFLHSLFAFIMISTCILDFLSKNHTLYLIYHSCGGLFDSRFIIIYPFSYALIVSRVTIQIELHLPVIDFSTFFSFLLSAQSLSFYLGYPILLLARFIKK